MENIFINRLIELMEEKDMSQVSLSKLIGTTNVTISRYISGERKPRIEIVEKIAEVFDVSLDYLLGTSNIRNLPIGKNIHPKIQTKLDNFTNILSKNSFTNEQLLIIETLLETNIDFISKLNSNNKNIS